MLNICFTTSIVYFNIEKIIVTLCYKMNNDENKLDPSDYRAIAPYCLPVVELLAATAGIDPKLLLEGFDLDITNIGQVELKMGNITKKIQLILTTDNTYETNIAEEAGKLPAEFGTKLLNCGGYLLLLARIFYKRLLQEFPTTFTVITNNIKDMEKDPSILECLGVNTDRTTLFLEENGKQIGLLVI